MKNRSRHSRTTAFLVLGFALVAGMTSAPAARAAPLNVTAQRSVVVGDLAHGTFYGGISPHGATGLFGDDVEAYLGGTHEYPGYPDFTTNEKAVATQSSNIDAASGLVAGTGVVGIEFSVVDADLAFAKSSIDVWFDLASAHHYTLSGELVAKMDGGLGLASVQLEGPTGFLYQKQGWGSEPLSYGGTLTAGSYHLRIATLIQPQCEPADCTAFSWMGGTSSFDVGFQVTAVPEATTYAMLLAGLGLLVVVSRRRDQRLPGPD